MFPALPWQNRISPRRSCAGVGIHHPHSWTPSSVVNASSRNANPAAAGVWAISRGRSRRASRGRRRPAASVGRVLGRGALSASEP